VMLAPALMVILADKVLNLETTAQDDESLLEHAS
jgi:hypothetical protein